MLWAWRAWITVELSRTQSGSLLAITNNKLVCGGTAIVFGLPSVDGGYLGQDSVFRFPYTVYGPTSQQESDVSPHKTQTKILWLVSTESLLNMNADTSKTDNWCISASFTLHMDYLRASPQSLLKPDWSNYRNRSQKDPGPKILSLTDSCAEAV